MPSPKQEELHSLLTLQSFIEECLAINSKFINDRSDAESLYNKTAGELWWQNVEHVDDMERYVKKAMHNKAEAYYKDKANSPEFATNDFKEKPALAPVFSHIAYNEIRQAVKQHRSDKDFALFEVVTAGYSYKEIAEAMDETTVTEGALRVRWCNLCKWINKHFNEK